MKLLRFPFLVQKRIFEDIDLLAVLSITMLSKKSHATVRTCLRHHKYHLYYVEDHCFRLERVFLNEDGNTLFIRLRDPKYQSSPRQPNQLWHIGNQEVPIESKCKESNGIISILSQVYSDKMLDFVLETLQYLTRLLPEVSLSLKLATSSVETFRRIMQSVENVKEIKEISVIDYSWDENPVSQEELAKLVLDESHRAKNLRVAVSTSDSFEYPITVPFKLDSINIIPAGWVSKDHFIKMFLSCKTVRLHWKNFNDEELTAIFKAWAEGSPLEILQFVGTDNFYQGRTLNSILEEFPGAAPIRNAMVPTGAFSTVPFVVTFGEGKCFLIQQNDGQTKALVYIDSHSVMLSTNFQIGKLTSIPTCRLSSPQVRLHLKLIMLKVSTKRVWI